MRGVDCDSLRNHLVSRELFVSCTATCEFRNQRQAKVPVYGILPFFRRRCFPTDAWKWSRLDDRWMTRSTRFERLMLSHSRSWKGISRHSVFDFVQLVRIICSVESSLGRGNWFGCQRFVRLPSSACMSQNLPGVVPVRFGDPMRTIKGVTEDE